MIAEAAKRYREQELALLMDSKQRVADPERVKKIHSKSTFSLPALMAPSPGTPVGGERAPRSPRQGAVAAGGMEIDSGGDASRVFCPVAGCPCAGPLRARGWASATTMQAQIDAHLAGSLQGDVPDAMVPSPGPPTMPGVWIECVHPPWRAPNVSPTGTGCCRPRWCSAPG